MITMSGFTPVSNRDSFPSTFVVEAEVSGTVMLRSRHFRTTTVDRYHKREETICFLYLSTPNRENMF